MYALSYLSANLFVLFSSCNHVDCGKTFPLCFKLVVEPGCWPESFGVTVQCAQVMIGICLKSGFFW